MKFCKDCKYYGKRVLASPVCLNPAANLNEEFYLVSGRKDDAASCWKARWAHRECGHEGKLWEAK